MAAVSTAAGVDTVMGSGYPSPGWASGLSGHPCSWLFYQQHTFEIRSFIQDQFYETCAVIPLLQYVKHFFNVKAQFQL